MTVKHSFPLIPTAAIVFVCSAVSIVDRSTYLSSAPSQPEAVSTSTNLTVSTALTSSDSLITISNDGRVLVNCKRAEELLAKPHPERGTWEYDHSVDAFAQLAKAVCDGTWERMDE